MKNSGYMEVPHIADIAMRVWSEDFYSLLAEAAKGMYELMGVESHEKFTSSIVFDLDRSNQEILIVDFLNELLYLSEEKQIILRNISFQETNNKVVVTAAGHSLLKHNRQIKAVTFHNLEIDQKDLCVETTITFDI
jgi:SHS2 domain-containing protein